MTTSHNVGTINVRGDEIPVRLDVYSTGATFVGLLGETEVRADTWETLGSALSKEIGKRAKKLDIVFTSAETLETGRVYAIHAGTGNPMVAWQDGSKTQATSWRSINGLRPLLASEIEEGRKLRDAADATEKAWRKWQADRRLDVHAAIKVALAEEG